jgi:hypothetical protein
LARKTDVLPKDTNDIGLLEETPSDVGCIGFGCERFGFLTLSSDMQDMPSSMRRRGSRGHLRQMSITMDLSLGEMLISVQMIRKWKRDIDLPGSREWTT